MLNIVKKIKKAGITGLGVLIAAVALCAVAPTITPAGHVYADNNVCKVDANGKLINTDPNAAPCTLNGKICTNVNDAPTATCQTGDPAAANGCTNGDCSTIITKYVNPAIKLLTILIGLVVAISIVVGGIQYASSAGDPSKVTAAKQRITNSLLALIAYIFLFGFLQFIVPGGII